jgi:hypothetical protein
MEENPLDKPPPPLSTERQREVMLAEVMMDTEAKEAARRPGPQRGTTWTRIAVASVLTLLAGWAWLLPPSFLQPPPPPAQSSMRIEAGLRFAVALQAERIFEFRTEAQRFPDYLREVGDTLPGLTYRRVDGGSFLLRGQVGDVMVQYRSSDELGDFLGNAIRTLERER